MACLVSRMFTAARLDYFVVAYWSCCVLENCDSMIVITLDWRNVKLKILNVSCYKTASRFIKLQEEKQPQKFRRKLHVQRCEFIC